MVTAAPAIKERPIIYSSPMVRALLRDANPKTQTRRIVKPQPTWRNVAGAFASWVFKGGFLYPNSKPEVLKLCPYGKPKDQLWVRETWQGPLLTEEAFAEYHEDGPERFKNPEHCVYRATDVLDAIDFDGNELGWRPSIHMPRWASRIDLEITDVRVDRLQNISEADAIAEGIEQRADHLGTTYKNYLHEGDWFYSPIISFESLWVSIYGPEAWRANPWVWVIAFRRVEPAA